MIEGDIHDEKTILKKEPQLFELFEEVVKNEIKQCVGKIMSIGIGTCSFVFFRQMNFKFILTNNHVVSKEFLTSYDNIVIEITKIKKEINLKKERVIYSNENLDFTIIQILESDFIDNYLEIDDSIWNSNYENQTIYCLEFPQGKDLKFDIGEIKEIKNGIIKHNVSTKHGSSGSPLISTDHKIIGIHKGYKKEKIKNGNNEVYNCGIFIKDIIMNIIENNLICIR